MRLDASGAQGASNALPSARRPQELHCAGSAMKEARRFRGLWDIDRVVKRLSASGTAATATSATSKNRDSYRAKRTTPRASRRSSSPKASTSTAAPRGPRAKPSRVVSESDEEEDGDGRMRDRPGGGDDGDQ
ncbi:hypothetical protein GGX14DRAFT_566806 [Mycena pura]|uniref:Uncharacterized protein n=1 Tax=Mycena pura TaxID=153505 RepID=A0AAD6VJA6_9AGAR|nr:hypothetical protein GGX14DRAFT_566806 [Mycena pura]